jgi:CheY-like chemotaxis protein
MLPFVCDPANPATFAHPLAGAGQAPTILLVEDEPLVRELAVEMLEDEGCRVLAAASAEEALALMCGTKADVLFTDIDLGPGLNGLALARALRVVAPDLAVIYVSGGRRALKPGEGVTGSAFLPKPYRAQHVRSVMAEMLTRRQGF